MWYWSSWTTSSTCTLLPNPSSERRGVVSKLLFSMCTLCLVWALSNSYIPSGSVFSFLSIFTHTLTHTQSKCVWFKRSWTRSEKHSRHSRGTEQTILCCMLFSDCFSWSYQFYCICDSVSLSLSARTSEHLCSHKNALIILGPESEEVRQGHRGH